MDLGDIWQAHKKFILGVGAGLIVFLIAQSVVGSTWDVNAVRQSAFGTVSRIRKIEVPRDSELKRVEREASTYEETLERLIAGMGYDTPEAYRLPKSGSPDLYFNEVRERATDELVNGARRLNIDVDPTLGLPGLTPPGREAIQRTLRGLSVVEQVVSAAVLAGVSSVDKIQMTKPRGRRGTEGGFIDELEVSFEIHGPTAAVAQVVESLARANATEGFRFLAFRDYEMKLDDKDAFGRTRLKLTVAALAIDPEATLPGGRR